MAEIMARVTSAQATGTTLAPGLVYHLKIIYTAAR